MHRIESVEQFVEFLKANEVNLRFKGNVFVYWLTRNPEHLRLLEEEKERAGLGKEDITLLVPELLEDANLRLYTSVIGSKKDGYNITVSSTENLRDRIKHALSHFRASLKSYKEKCNDLPFLVVAYFSDIPKMLNEKPVHWECINDGHQVPLCVSKYTVGNLY